MSKEKAKICIESALSKFGLYESLCIRDYLKSAYDNMLKALKELEDWLWQRKKLKKYCLLFKQLLMDKNLNLPKGSIKRLIGRELSWEDEPVELKEN